MTCAGILDHVPHSPRNSAKKEIERDSRRRVSKLSVIMALIAFNHVEVSNLAETKIPDESLRNCSSCILDYDDCQDLDRDGKSVTVFESEQHPDVMQKELSVIRALRQLQLQASHVKSQVNGHRSFRPMTTQKRGTSTLRMDRKRPVPIFAAENEVARVLWQRFVDVLHMRKHCFPGYTASTHFQTLLLQETRIAFKDSTTADRASDIAESSDEGSETIKLLQREASGSFKIMGLTPSAELVAISMGMIGPILIKSAQRVGSKLKCNTTDKGLTSAFCVQCTLSKVSCSYSSCCCSQCSGNSCHKRGTDCSGVNRNHRSRSFGYLVPLQG